jgi:hypothetical protein
MRYIVFLLAIVALAAPPAAAQLSYPMVMSLEPVAAQIGQTSEHQVRSRYSMFGAYDVLVSGSGVTGTIIPPEMTEEEKAKKPKLETMKIQFTVAADALPGVRDFRIATPNGASTIGQLVIARDAVVVESGDNNTKDKALAVTMPSTICGAIEKAEDVDYFKFTAAKGEGLSFHVRCMRLQNRIHDLQQHADPLITLRTAAGTTIAAADNYYAGDPYLAHTFEQDGEYLLEIRDVRFQGNQYWKYSIEVSNRPHVTNVYPLAVNPGTPTSLKMIGFQLPGQAATFNKMVGEVGFGPQWVLLELGGELSNPVPVVVTDQPLVQELEADNGSLEMAQSVAIPGGINGRIETQADIDYFVFEAKKDQQLTIDVVARRHQSMLDSHLRVLSSDGKQLAISDDFKVGKRNYADSRVENWKVPADGKYLVEIRDLHLRGGDEFVYFIDITLAKPHFFLAADTDKTQLSPGTSGVMFVRIERKNGFAGEVQLQAEGMGEGITASCGRILEGRNDGCIIFQAAPDAPMQLGNVRISGTGMIKVGDAEEPMTVEADYYQETYMPGGGRNHFPVEAHSVSVGAPADLLAVTLSTYKLTLQPGESVQVDVEIKRAEGFEKNVTLDALFQHLGSVYGDSLPEGISIDSNKSKTLLTGDTVKGHLTFTASDKAKPVENQQVSVMANVSLNFVMKATYSSTPLLITVTSE